MRKHSVRKWLHAICDLLPLLVIPIFALAVRSDNNFHPIELQVNERRSFDLYQQFKIERVVANATGITAVVMDDCTVKLTGTAVDSNLWFNEGYSSTNTIFTCLANHKYYGVNLLGFNNTTSVFNSNNGIISYASDTSITGWRMVSVNNQSFDAYLMHFQLFDLTEIYGAGNEPTIEEFNSTFTNEYYLFGHHEIVIDNYDAITFNDTDVGSQMVYTLYNTCDKYFNFNNVGVFQDLYNWFGTNLFNGSTPPMSFFIVWNVILYEFIMDLIFLTYMVFMFVIDFTECMIDRFFEKSYRGGR